MRKRVTFLMTVALFGCERSASPTDATTTASAQSTASASGASAPSNASLSGRNVRKVQALLIERGFEISDGSTSVNGDFDVEAKHEQHSVRVSWSHSEPGPMRDVRTRIDKEWTLATIQSDAGVLAVGCHADGTPQPRVAEKLLADVLRRFADPTLPYAVMRAPAPAWLRPREEVVDNHRTIAPQLTAQLKQAFINLGYHQVVIGEQRRDLGNPKDTGIPGASVRGSAASHGGEQAKVEIRCFEQGSSFIAKEWNAKVGEAIYLSSPCHMLASVSPGFGKAPQRDKSKALLEKLFALKTAPAPADTDAGTP